MTVINNYKTWLALMRQVNVQQNGQIPPSVFNTWYNEVNSWLFKDLVEQYQLTQVISDLLSPFVIPVNILVKAKPGENWAQALYPPDYQYFTNATILRQREESGDKSCLKPDTSIIDGAGKSLKYTDPDMAEMIARFAATNVEEQQVFLIDTARWAACLNHYSKRPTWNKPKMTQFKNGFKVAPRDITSIVLYYLKTPRESVFSYTISPDDILIYDAAGSTQLEWSDQVLPIFLAELQKKYATYIGDEKLYQMAENDKKSA